MAYVLNQAWIQSEKIKQGENMKTIALLLITAMVTIFGYPVVAENYLPPPNGPYRSIHGAEPYESSHDMAVHSHEDNKPSQLSSHQHQAANSIQDRNTEVMSRWNEKRESDVDNNVRQQNDRYPPVWMNQSPQQMEAPEWAQRQQAQMWQGMSRSNTPPPPMYQDNLYQQHPNNNMPAPVPNSYANGMQRYFPAARGPVFGPSVPPPGFRAPPNYMPPQQWNSNQPERR